MSHSILSSMAGMRPPNLVSPTPHRRYASGLLNNDMPTAEQAPQTSANATWIAGLGTLKRPASAPAGSLSSGAMCFERPSSPFSRVGNPMVRDRLFVKGLQDNAVVRKEGKGGGL